MVKIEPVHLQQPPTKFEFLEFMNQNIPFICGLIPTEIIETIIEKIGDYYWYSSIITGYTWKLADIEASSGASWWFQNSLEIFQSQMVSKSIFEEYLNGDWRQGQEIQKIVITQRLYQISPNTTQA